MNGFARGFGTVAVSLSGLLIVLTGVGYAVTTYLDNNFGDGITAIIVSMFSGIGMTVLIYTLAGFQNNQTHRAAGEDITEFHKNGSRIQLEAEKVRREELRKDRELTVAAVKQHVKLSDKEQAAAAEDAQWAWVFDDNDADAPVYYQ